MYFRNLHRLPRVLIKSHVVLRVVTQAEQKLTLPLACSDAVYTEDSCLSYDRNSDRSVGFNRFCVRRSILAKMFSASKSGELVRRCLISSV